MEGIFKMNKLKSLIKSIDTAWESTFFYRKLGLSGFALKLIACLTMVIDHAAIVLVRPYADMNVGNMPFERFEFLYFTLYDLMRAVGRIAFPIFCFLLVEGFLHTKNFGKYALNLLVTGIIAEPVFDLVLFDSFPDFTHQNTLFTLLIGLCCIHLLDSLIRRRYSVLQKLGKPGIFVLCIIAIAGSMAISYYLYTDYGHRSAEGFFLQGRGVLAIVLLYLFHDSKIAQSVIGNLPFEYEPAAFFSILPMMLYNKKRGFTSKLVKYGFYAFYPLHLMLLYIIAVLLGCR